MNNILKWFLSAGVYFLEQSDRNTSDMADRVKHGVHNFSRRARHVLHEREEHRVRHVISFATGISLGIGVGLLLAPSSGERTRSSIAGKVHDFSDRAKEHFAHEKEHFAHEKDHLAHELKRPATGTAGM